jgi:hypothetical protein
MFNVEDAQPASRVGLVAACGIHCVADEAALQFGHCGVGWINATGVASQKLFAACSTDSPLAKVSSSASTWRCRGLSSARGDPTTALSSRTLPGQSRCHPSTAQ